MKKKTFTIIGISVAVLALFIGFWPTEASHISPYEPHGACDPRSPFNPHQTGIIHCRNYTPEGYCAIPFRDDEYKDGLCFPSFNNYTDNRLTHDGSIGGVPLFSDERRFLLARLSTERFENIRQEIIVQPGDRVQFVAYVHNDADPNHNLDDFGVPTRSMATRVRTHVDSFFYDRSLQNYATPANTEFSIRQFITAANTTPQEVSDDVRIISGTGAPVRLKYALLASDGKPSAKFKYGNPPKYRYFTAIDLFKNGAAFGAPDTNSDIYFGSEDYRGYLYFSVDVITAPAPVPPAQITPAAPPAECQNLTVSPHEFSGQENNPILLRANVIPETFENIEWEAIYGNIEVVPGTRSREIILTTRNAETVIVARSPDGRCRDEIRSARETPKKNIQAVVAPPVLCQSITVFPTEFRQDDNRPKLFQITNVKPVNFKGVFYWTVSGGGRLTASADTRSAVLLDATSKTNIKVQSYDLGCTVNISGKESPAPPMNFAVPAAPPVPNAEMAPKPAVNAMPLVAVPNAIFESFPRSPQTQISCANLQISPTEFLRNFPLQAFRASVSPQSFTGVVGWRHFKKGKLVEAKNGFRVTFDHLDATSSVIAEAVPAARPAACTRQSMPEKPPSTKKR